MVEWLPAVHEGIGFFPRTPGKKEEKEKKRTPRAAMHSPGKRALCLAAASLILLTVSSLSGTFLFQLSFLYLSALHREETRPREPWSVVRSPVIKVQEAKRPRSKLQPSIFKKCHLNMKLTAL